eukprot:scaffold17189_cov28-Tisochrysis_lutea.AAC.3
MAKQHPMPRERVERVVATDRNERGAALRLGARAEDEACVLPPHETAKAAQIRRWRHPDADGEQRERRLLGQFGRLRFAFWHLGRGPLRQQPNRTSGSVHHHLLQRRLAEREADAVLRPELCRVER